MLGSTVNFISNPFSHLSSKACLKLASMENLLPSGNLTSGISSLAYTGTACCYLAIASTDLSIIAGWA